MKLPPVIQLMLVVISCFSCNHTSEVNNDLKKKDNYRVSREKKKEQREVKRNHHKNDASLETAIELSFYGPDYRFYKKMASNAIETGDKIGYRKASSFFMLSPTRNDFLYFAQEMAERYSYSNAYYDIFLINYLDKKTFNRRINYHALFCLARAYELGYELNLSELSLIKDKGRTTNSSSFLDSLKLSWSMSSLPY